MAHFSVVVVVVDVACLVCPCFGIIWGEVPIKKKKKRKRGRERGEGEKEERCQRPRRPHANEEEGAWAREEERELTFRSGLL